MSAKRKGHSYRMALITHIKDWRLTIDKGKFAGIIFTDTSKAFYSFYPLLMVKKLQAYTFSDES